MTNCPLDILSTVTAKHWMIWLWYNKKQRCTFLTLEMKGHVVKKDLNNYFALLFPTFTICMESLYRFYFNSLWSGVAIWRHRSGSTLAQVMACCLKAPSYYLNQCWFLISEILWHSPGSNFTLNAQAVILYNEFENSTFKITAISIRAKKMLTNRF